MGVFHHFKELDTPGVGSKQVKFKQNVLNALASKIEVSNLLAFVNKDGSCTGHSISWAVGRAKSKVGFSDNYSRDMTGATSTTFETGMRVQSAFRQFNKTGFVDALPKFFKSNDYEVTAERIVLQQDNIGAALLTTAKALKAGEAAILAYYIGASEASHAIAIYKESDSDLLFFDPNVGEYKVLDAAKFFAAYEKICQKLFNVTDLEACSFRIVKEDD